MLVLVFLGLLEEEDFLDLAEDGEFERKSLSLLAFSDSLTLPFLFLSTSRGEAF